jgi:hypothetical protein
MLPRGDHTCLSPWLLLRKHPLLCCALYSVFGLGAKSADDGFGARSTRGESGYSEPEQFLSVFLLRLFLFPSGERESCLCYLTRRESVWGVRSAAAHILNPRTRWGWVVRRPCCCTSGTRYALNRRLRGSRSRSESSGEARSPPRREFFNRPALFFSR